MTNVKKELEEQVPDVKDIVNILEQKVNRLETRHQIITMESTGSALG